VRQDQDVTVPEAPSPADDDPLLRITAHTYGSTVVVEVAGEIDMDTAPELAEALTTALADHPAAVVADLSAVTYLDSAGLRVLVTAHTAAHGTTGFAVVANSSATVRPLQITGLDQELTIFDSAGLPWSPSQN
jgi:anti-sigma B factor antagonist